MAASSTAVTVKSESGFGYAYVQEFWQFLQKYIAVCRGDLFFGAAKVYFGSGNKKEIWKRDSWFCFGVIWCDEYQENNLLLFYIYMRVLI